MQDGLCPHLRSPGPQLEIRLQIKSALSFLAKALYLHLCLPCTHPTTGAAPTSLHPKLENRAEKESQGRCTRHQGAITSAFKKKKKEVYFSNTVNQCFIFSIAGGTRPAVSFR